jgi:hypothetical protein
LLRFHRYSGVLFVLAWVVAVVSSDAQPPSSFAEEFDTVPAWAAACASPGTVLINPSNPTGGPVFDPVFNSNVLEVIVVPPNILFYCGPPGSYTNFAAEIAARKYGGPVPNPNLAAVYGIIFRAQGPTFYWFTVSTAGYYGLFKFPAPGPRPWGTLSHPGVEIVPWTWDFGVATGNSPNTLRIEVQGLQAKLFVNGELKRTAILLSDGPASGQIGVGIGTFELFPWAGVRVSFDYLRIWE